MFKLIIKDFRGNNKRGLFNFVIIMLLSGNIITYQYLGWISYFLLACIITQISGSIYPIWEKSRSIEILTCSLPVSRNKVVYSRYLASLIIAVSGLIMWSLNAYIADLIWRASSTQLSDLFNLNILIMAFFMISIHFSIFLPSAFHFRRFGMIIFIVFSIILSIVLTVIIFMPDNGLFNPNLEAEKTSAYVILLLIVLPLISLQLSKFLFNKKDLE